MPAVAEPFSEDELRSIADRANELAHDQEDDAMSKNTICLWYDKDAEEAARFYADTFPDSKIGAIIRARLPEAS